MGDEERQLKYRKLRTAWSVAWGVVSVLLCVLWVRSIWRVDYVRVPIGTSWVVVLSSLPGTCEVNIYENMFGDTVDSEWSSRSAVQWWSGVNRIHLESRFFGTFHYWKGTTWVPHWFLTLLTALTATVLWLPRRFSLRTLLIATTLIAVVLGLIVWAVGSGK